MPAVPAPGGASRALPTCGGADRPNCSQTDTRGMALARNRSWSSCNGVATRGVDARLTALGIPGLGTHWSLIPVTAPLGIRGALTRECQSAPTVFQVRILIASRQHGKLPERSKWRVPAEAILWLVRAVIVYLVYLVYL